MERQYNRTARRRFREAAWAAIALANAAGAALGASGTWSGAANDGLWQSPGNWDNVPGSNDAGAGTSADIATFNATPTSLTAEVDPSRNVGGLTFDSSTAAFLVNATPNTGNTLFLSNGGTIQTTANVVPAVEANNDINAPVVLNGTGYTFTNLSAALTAGMRFRGNISGGNAAATTLTLDGVPGSFSEALSEIHGTISNGASSALGLLKTGAGAWDMNTPGTAPNTYTGDTVINGGVLRVATSGTNDGVGALSANSNYIINNTGRLRINVAGNTARSVTVNLGGTFDVVTAASTTVNLKNENGPALVLNYSGGPGTNLNLPFNLTGTTPGQGGVTLTANASTAAMDLTGTASTLDLGSVKRVFDVGKGAGINYDLRIRGPLTGGGANGGITKIGPGVLRIDSPSNFSGNVDIQQGTFKINASNLLTGNVSIRLATNAALTVNSSGSDIIPLNVNSGPALHIDYTTATHAGTVTALNVLISLTGTTPNEGGIKYSATSTGGTPTGQTDFGDTAKTLTLGSAMRPFDIGKGNPSNSYDLRVRGPVTGGGPSGGILKMGAGILRLDNPANSFTGKIEVREGDFRLSSAASNTLTGTPQLLISGGNVHIFGSGAATQTFGAVTVTKGSTTGSAANSTIAAPSFTFDVATPDSVSIDTALTNAGGASPLVKNLGGSVTLLRALSYTGSTTVTAGTLSLGTDLTTSPSVSVTGGKLELRVTATPNRVIKTSSLSISGIGQVDLQHNKLIVSGGTIGTPTAGDYDGITGMIQDGRNGGTWDGPGIMTSQSDADTGVKGLGIRAATAGQVFAAQTLSAGDVMVMYSYIGDATLNGVLDGDDFSAIDAGFSASSSGYANGDFDYNGRIDADDYFLIDRNYSRYTGPITPAPVAGGITAVPEPASISLLLVAAVPLLSRKRRHS